MSEKPNKPSVPPPDKIKFIEPKKIPKHINAAFELAKNLYEKKLKGINIPFTAIWDAVFNINPNESHQVFIDPGFVWEIMSILGKGDEYKSIRQINIEGGKIITIQYFAEGQTFTIKLFLIGLVNGRINAELKTENIRNVMGVFEGHAGKLSKNLSLYSNSSAFPQQEQPDLEDKIEFEVQDNSVEQTPGFNLNIPKDVFTELIILSIIENFVANVRTVNLDWEAQIINVEFVKSFLLNQNELTFKINDFNEESLSLEVLNLSPASLWLLVQNTPLLSIPNFVRVVELSSLAESIKQHLINKFRLMKLKLTKHSIANT